LKHSLARKPSNKSTINPTFNLKPQQSQSVFYLSQEIFGLKGQFKTAQGSALGFWSSNHQRPERAI
jgi:hypothetical protein